MVNVDAGFDRYAQSYRHCQSRVAASKLKLARRAIDWYESCCSRGYVIADIARIRCRTPALKIMGYWRHWRVRYSHSEIHARLSKPSLPDWGLSHISILVRTPRHAARLTVGDARKRQVGSLVTIRKLIPHNYQEMQLHHSWKGSHHCAQITNFSLLIHWYYIWI